MRFCFEVQLCSHDYAIGDENHMNLRDIRKKKLYYASVLCGTFHKIWDFSAQFELHNNSTDYRFLKEYPS